MRFKLAFIALGAALCAPLIATTAHAQASARGDRIRAFAAEYFRRTGTTGQPGDPLPWLARHYADNVDFFGKNTPRSEILRQKAEYLRRWPVRSYRIEPGSMRVECQVNGPRCHVSGIIDWTTHSSQRLTDADGASSFDFTILDEGGLQTIVSESSTVLNRAHYKVHD